MNVEIKRNNILIRYYLGKRYWRYVQDFEEKCTGKGSDQEIRAELRKTARCRLTEICQRVVRERQFKEFNEEQLEDERRARGR